MKFFFESLEKLNKYASEVKNRTCCPHCAKKCFLISHGFIYKKTISGTKCIIGRRIYCSNRFNKNGCGRTFQLYIALIHPKIHYNATHSSTFVSCLIKCQSIQLAYLEATGSSEPRNAYRWIKKLYNNLTLFRNYIYMSGLNIITWSNDYKKNSYRSVLTSTLNQLQSLLKLNCSQRFQELAQKSFL